MKEFNEITLQKIEDYVMDRLDATERTLFETELATDAELRKETDQTIKVKVAAERSQLRSKIKTIQSKKIAEWNNEASKSEEQETPIKRVNWLRRSTTFAAAASVLFVVYLALSPVSLPNATIISERGNSTADSLQTTVMLKYSTAINALQNEDFETAAKLFDEVATNQNIRPYYQEAATWYGGIAQIETNPIVAELKINSVINKENKAFKIDLLDRLRVWLKLKMSK